MFSPDNPGERDHVFSRHAGLRRHDGLTVVAGRLLAVLCIALLQACATPHPPEVFSPALPPTAELTDTPFFAQDDYQCGPAALAMVLQADAVEVTPQQLQPLVYLPDNKGSLQVEMLAAASHYGRLAVRIPPDVDSLLQEVAAGRPVLVLQNLGHRLLPVWHYAVVVGYDLEAREIYLRSGRDARKVYPMQRFLDSWAGAQHWALVVVAPGKVPVSVSAAAYLRAASALERRQAVAAAWRAYHAGTRRWPEYALLWAAAGNAAYTLQRFADATAAYRRALSLQPGNVSVMNNLALALAARGCRQQAQSVLECALAQAPEDANLLLTRREINALKATAGVCEDFACTPAGH
ncbi:MAG TPA: bacteriocin-processing peptidase family protein [Gammaproteobacteria bacterium]|nr:bacteriocin-processing peptidase family protein [Gammaproteobacteria bacterium]